MRGPSAPQINRDKSTAAFFRSYKAAAKQQWVNETNSYDEWREGEEPHYTSTTTNPKKIAAEFMNFYRTLFKDKVTKADRRAYMMKHLSKKAIPKTSSMQLDKPLTLKEITQVMENLPLGKQAGPDRIPNAVYKYCSKLFAPKLLTVLLEATRTGQLPPTMIQGDITVMYKKGDRTEVRNYRPLTMLQNAYKIFTRALAQRMKTVVHLFISECQKGFVPDTFIADCSMLLNLTEAYINEEDTDRHGILLFLDMEKAFDRVSYTYILESLTAVGFGQNFRNMVQLMYNLRSPPQRRIYTNGYYSEWFEAKSGVAQGCPLSPLLFLLVAQGLKIATTRAGIEGIKVGRTRHNISQFADDTALLLRGWGDMRKVQGALDFWSEATGMKENHNKREGILLGNYRGKKPPNEFANIKWVKEGEWAISLGVPIGNNLNHTKYWNKKLQAVRDKANRWVGLFRSSYFGRNLIVQAMYFGSLRYWLYSIPMTKEQILTIQKDADRLWWSRDPILDDQKVRVRRWVALDTAIGPRNLGGLGNMDWKAHVTAIRAHWVIRYLHPSDAAWKTVIDDLMLLSRDGSYKFGANRGVLMTPLSTLDKTRLLQGIPLNAKYWRECIKAHWKINYKFDTDQPTTGGEPIWESPRFTITTPRRTRQYLINTLQITQLSDIINKDTETPFTGDEWEEWIKELHNGNTLNPSPHNPS